MSPALFIALYGLPVSLSVTVLLGLAVWRWAEKAGRTGWRDAAWAGAGAGLLLGVPLLAANALSPILAGVSSMSASSVKGWLAGLAALLRWAATGAVVGLVARWAAGRV